VFERCLLLLPEICKFFKHTLVSAKEQQLCHRFTVSL
jgi:hypothetical protein